MIDRLQIYKDALELVEKQLSIADMIDNWTRRVYVVDGLTRRAEALRERIATYNPNDPPDPPTKSELYREAIRLYGSRKPMFPAISEQSQRPWLEKAMTSLTTTRDLFHPQWMD